MGYALLGHEIVGVDISPQPRYPFPFILGDALDFPLDNFDFIHASPPCQGYSRLRHRSPDVSYPRMVKRLRKRLEQTGLPYCIENVDTAPLKSPTILCGTMFGLGSAGRQLLRHRGFETNFKVDPRECDHRRPAIGVHGGGPTTKKRTDLKGGRSYQGTLFEKQDAMGVYWMKTHAEVNEAIPPAYTRYIARFIPA